MPRYFFDVDDGERRLVDEAGLDLPGLDAVAAEAFNLLRDLVHDRMPEGRRTMLVRVRDADGALAYSGEMTIDGKRLRP